MGKLTINQKLDKILIESQDFKANRCPGVFLTLRVARHLPFENQNEFNALLTQLAKDEYIEVNELFTFVKLTIKGSIFIGYEKKQILDDETIATASGSLIQNKIYLNRLLWATCDQQVLKPVLHKEFSAFG